MTEKQQQSLDTVKAFYAAKERRDLDATVQLFADDIVYRFPLNASGEPTPWFVYEGKAATTEYQRGVLTRFSRLRMVDPEYTVSDNGERVFVTTKGDYVQEEGQRPYRNVYVFRFEIQDGRIQRVDEYANPVTYAQLAGLPIG